MSIANSPSQTFIREMVALLATENENFLLTTYFHSNSSNLYEEMYICRNYQWDNLRQTGIVEFFRKKYRNPMNILSHIFSKFRRLTGREGTDIENYISSIEPDRIIFHFGWAFDEYSWIEKKFNDVPVVICLHGSDITEYSVRKPLLLQKLREVSNRNNVLITTCSSYLRELALAKGVKAEACKVLYNTYSKSFESCFRKRDSYDGALKIINVARMVSWKGQSDLIEAFAEFNKLHPRSRLTLVGDGPCREDLVVLGKKLKVDKCINFTGSIDHSEIPALMAKHHVYVQPSLQDDSSGQAETFGVVLLEAIASGLFVIATNSGGMPEVVANEKYRNKHYFIVKPGNSKQIRYMLEIIEQNFKRFHLDIADYRVEQLAKFSNERYRKNLIEILSLDDST